MYERSMGSRLHPPLLVGCALHNFSFCWYWCMGMQSYKEETGIGGECARRQAMSSHRKSIGKTQLRMWSDKGIVVSEQSSSCTPSCQCITCTHCGCKHVHEHINLQHAPFTYVPILSINKKVAGLHFTSVIKATERHDLQGTHSCPVTILLLVQQSNLSCIESCFLFIPKSIKDSSCFHIDHQLVTSIHQTLCTLTSTCDELHNISHHLLFAQKPSQLQSCLQFECQCCCPVVKLDYIQVKGMDHLRL